MKQKKALFQRSGGAPINTLSRSKTALHRGVALSTGPYTHLDHLGILSIMMGVSLLVTDEKKYQLAQTFYPDIKVQFIEHLALSPDYLCANFDHIFHCGKYICSELSPLVQQNPRKKMRFIFCPHGNSDKEDTPYAPHSHPSQDIALVYGSHMLDLLKKSGAIEKIRSIVMTGNYRYPFYRQHQKFYDRLAQKEIFSRLDPSKKTILYAPTWAKGESNPLFFEECQLLIDQLSSSYNLLIKLHPFLEEEEPARFYALKAKNEKKKNLLFVSDFPAIYPLLAGTDIYLGDYSSIGYDFLLFNRPMYFLVPKPTTPLHQCGIAIGPEQKKDVIKFLSETLKKNADNPLRQKIYNYAFGREREPHEIKNELFRAPSY